MNNEVGEWAFGALWYKYLTFDVDSRELWKAWNIRHGEMHWIRRSIEMPKNLNKILELYEKRPMPLNGDITGLRLRVDRKIMDQE